MDDMNWPDKRKKDIGPNWSNKPRACRDDKLSVDSETQGIDSLLQARHHLEG
jgi:hypothetical protein